MKRKNSNFLFDLKHSDFWVGLKYHNYLKLRIIFSILVVIFNIVLSEILLKVGFFSPEDGFKIFGENIGIILFILYSFFESYIEGIWCWCQEFLYQVHLGKIGKIILWTFISLIEVLCFSLIFILSKYYYGLLIFAAYNIMLIFMINIIEEYNWNALPVVPTKYKPGPKKLNYIMPKFEDDNRKTKIIKKPEPLSDEDLF